MFFFKRRNSGKPDLSWLGADMHSHLIAAIDDGSPDKDTSLAMVKGLMELGYKKLITTPHVLSEMYPNTPEQIQNGLRELKESCLEQNISIELEAAAEYFIDESLEIALEKKSRLLTFGRNNVLVEFSMITAPMDLKKILFEIQIQNYQPVIAHPERYIYLTGNKAFYDELKDTGCMFQLNLLSLVGYYGTSVQELAEYLIKKKLYDYAGTDLHNVRQLSAFSRLSYSSSLKALRDSGLIRNHAL